MRIGIFGGSFDPPHIGHFLAAVDASEELALDRLFWVPAAQQPLKQTTPHQATPEQRYAMVSAATRCMPTFAPSRIEIDREGLSYTVTTVEAFAQLYPTAERFLLLGQDAWATFAEWHTPEHIRTLVHIAVFDRLVPSHSYTIVPPGTPDRWLSARRVDVSATEIRARVRTGKSIRGFVQDTVADIIETQGLYRDGN